MEKKYLVCLICCEEFKGGCGGGDLERKEEDLQSLQQFCEVILEVDKNELEGNAGFAIPLGSLEIKLVKLMENEDDNLSICRECLDLIKMVTEARLSAKCVEESVEKLQVLLLRELRRLQGRLNMFWGEFRKMEETLVNGDLKLIGNTLDKSYSQINGGSKKAKKLSGKHLERKREIFGFREKVSEVFRNFQQFKSKLVDKIGCDDPVSQAIQFTAPSKKMVDAQVQVEIQQNYKSKQKLDKQSSYENDKGLSSPLPQPPQNFDEIGNDNSDDDGNAGDLDPDDEPMDLDNSDDNDNHSDDNEVEKKPTNSRTSLRNRNTLKKYKDNSSDSDDNEDEEPQNSKEDDGDEYEPDEPVNNTISSRAQYTRTLKQLKPHLSNTSPFQRNVIRSVIKCQCLAENWQMLKGPQNTNLFQRHMISLSYNVETQLITLSDIPIKIVCEAEGENGLLCTKCDFKVAECPKMHTLMYDHVLSKHLNAYLCPLCKDKKFETYQYYRNHLWRCRNPPDILKVSCEICGKILSDRRSLRGHKWRHHMTEDEKKEALEKGLVKEYSVKSKKGMEKMFQCELCGKSFSSKAYLRSHEERHKDRDSREQFICQKCGKSFLKAGYDYHVKYDKSCGEDDNCKREVSCEKCGKILKNKVILRHHLRDIHDKGDLKPFGCEICGKAFRKRMGLKLHETTHTGEKGWSCGRCGKAFSRQNNMKRHEKSCGK